MSPRSVSGYRVPVIRTRRRCAAWAAVAAAVLSVSGCTAVVDGHGRPAGAPGSAAAAPSGPSAQGQRASAVLERAQDSLDHITGYEVKGTFTGTGSATVDLVVGIAGGHGTVTTPAGHTAVLDYTGYGAVPGSRASGLFVTAPAAYWTEVGVAANDATRYAGRPVSVPSTAPAASLVTLVDQKALTQLIFDTAGRLRAPSVLDSPAVDGQPAWIVDFGGDHATRMTVMSTGQQFPLRLVSPKADLSFGGFGVDPRVHTPSGTPLSLPAH